MSITLPVPLFNSLFWDPVALILGYVILLIFIAWFIFLIITAALFALSVRKKHLYCSWLIRPAYLLLKGAVRTGCRMFGIDDTEIITVLIRMENDVNQGEFAAIPIKKRIIFFPHCLRSMTCPAHLTPLGIKCFGCGKCDLGVATNVLTNAGYMVFIIPGSTYIKRLLKQLRPDAMIGVGCLTEIKQFQELARKIDMTAMGIVLKSDGCVETTVAWEDVFEVASIGLDKEIGENV